jgi:hypothetical protein
MPRAIGQAPGEGRGGAIPGGEFKRLQKGPDENSVRLGRELRDILKEAYDNMKDSRKTDEALSTAIDKGATAIENFEVGGEYAKRAALKNFKRILSDMALEVRDGRI